MVSAPVGWQCPICLKGAPAVRRMRDIQGGAFSLANGPPYATYVIMAVCVALYIGQQGSTDLTGRGVIVSFMVARGELWRVVTSGFLHASPIHLLFNMLILFQLGSALEGRLGRARFLGIYFSSLVSGSIGAMLLQSPTTPSLGASGAVFGLMGAVVVLSKRGRSPIESSVGVLLVINLVITFALPGISIGAHLGGLAAGALCGLVIRAFGEQAEGRRALLSAVVLLAFTVSLIGAAGPVAQWRCRSLEPSVSGLRSPEDLERVTDGICS